MPRINMRFMKLKNKLREMGLMPLSYAAEVLGWNTSTLSHLLNGHMIWSVKQGYQILDLIGEPHAKMDDYFPADDIAAYGQKKEPSSKTAQRGKTA